MRFLIGIPVFLALVSPALSQIDGATLRAKYGAPLNRETFQVRPNIEMVVNYGPNGQLFRIELPPGENMRGEVPANIATTQQVDEVIAEVVPLSVRGRETNRGSFMSGMNSMTMTDYEHVSLIAGYHGDTRTRISIIFKDAACRSDLLVH